MLPPEMARSGEKPGKLGLVEVVTLRLPRRLIDQIDQLTKRMQKAPEYADLRITKAHTIRLALRRGLGAIEHDLGRKK
jgi:hypothetical protein